MRPAPPRDGRDGGQTLAVSQVRPVGGSPAPGRARLNRRCRRAPALRPLRPFGPRAVRVREPAARAAPQEGGPGNAVIGWVIFFLIFGVGNVILYATTGAFIIPIPRR